MKPFTDQRTFKAVVGLGMTGLSCARFLAGQQVPFVMMDSRQAPPGLAEFKSAFPDVPLSLGPWQKDWLSHAEEIVVSPGIDTRSPEFAQHCTEDANIVGDIELFARQARAPIVAITGSNGKSTVTTLLTEMARCAGQEVRMGGNIGIPALDLLQSEEPDLYVLELSSFQLETTHSLALEAAVILNMAEDHLDRHHSLGDYLAAKQRIYQHCRHRVVNQDDPMLKAVASDHMTGFTLQSPGPNQFGISEHQGESYIAYGNEKWLPVQAMKLAGRHNWANALAALALGRAVQLPQAAMLQTLQTFSGLPHRCQYIAEYQGVTWYDDSKGTNIGATRAAVSGVAGEGKSVILIAGGVGKGADFTGLKEVVTKHVHHMIVLGESAADLQTALQEAVLITKVADMQEAVLTAKQLARPGDHVLLSPACASFDMFKDFAQRGDVFRHAVESTHA